MGFSHIAVKIPRYVYFFRTVMRETHQADRGRIRRRKARILA